MTLQDKKYSEQVWTFRIAVSIYPKIPVNVSKDKMKHSLQHISTATSKT